MTIIEAYQSAAEAPEDSPLFMAIRLPQVVKRPRIRLTKADGETIFLPYNPLPATMVALVEIGGHLDECKTHDDLATEAVLVASRPPESVMRSNGPFDYRVYQIECAWLLHNYPGSTFKLEYPDASSPSDV